MPSFFAHPAEETMMTSIEELESGSFSPNPLILDPELVYQPLEYTPQKKSTEKKKHSFLNSLAFAALFLTISFLLYSTAFYITMYQSKTSPIETIPQPPLLAWLNEDNVTDLASRIIQEGGTTYLTASIRFDPSIDSVKNAKQLIRIKQGMKTIYDFISDNEHHSVENGVVLFTPLTEFNLFMERVDHITITYSLEVAGKGIPWSTITFEKKFVQSKE